MALISPGIEVTVEDASQYVPFAAATVPLIIFATEAERKSLAGTVLTPMPGTFEFNVLRSLTSFTQAFNLYGTPRFLTDNAGQPMHGDCRNEVGLLTAYKWLQSNGRCYGIRAEIDLNDDANRLLVLWAEKIESSAQLLEATVQQRLDDYNATNGYYPGHPNYKSAVSVAELLIDADAVLQAALYSVFAFRDVQPTFQPTQTTPLPVYSNGYNQAPVDPAYPGFDSLVSQQVTVLSPARLATTSALTATASGGTLTNSGTLTTLSIDGTLAALGDRVLIKDQVDASQNGIYTVTDIGSVSIAWVLTRATDFDTSAEVTQGSYLTITDGVANTNTVFALTTMFVQVGAVVAATTAPLTVVSTSTTLTNDGTQVPLVMDGVTLVVGNRVLVKDQLLAAQNGIYVVTSTGSNSSDWVLTRASDYNSTADVYQNTYTIVGSGLLNINKKFAMITTGIITVGVTGLVFDETTGAIVVGDTAISFEQTTGIVYSPTEAAQLLVDAGAEYQYTTEFRDLTSLGSTDAERRASIVTSFQAMLSTNQDIRAETLDYNLIVCPGFPEVDDDLITFVSSQDIGEEVFIISAPPYNVNPEAAVTWGTSLTSDRKFSKLISYNYPHGITANLDGTDVFVPATLGTLNVYGYNDAVSQQWFAPAGTQRGAVRDFSRIGYLTGTLGDTTTFVDAPLSRGNRDDLYKFGTNLNPIANLPGRGIHLMGQKTSAPDASALDRVNVVRLLCYVRRQLRRNLIPFLFQPNDKITRDNVNSMVTGFLEGIKIRRGLYDFAVDTETGATPENIDNNILEVRIALSPTKALEFIYVKLQVVRTGAI